MGVYEKKVTKNAEFILLVYYVRKIRGFSKK